MGSEIASAGVPARGSGLELGDLKVLSDPNQCGLRVRAVPRRAVLCAVQQAPSTVCCVQAATRESPYTGNGHCKGRKRPGCSDPCILLGLLRLGAQGFWGCFEGDLSVWSDAVT